MYVNSVIVPAARDGSDYITNTSVQEVYSGSHLEKIYCLEVVIIDDLKVERNENFTVTLTTSLSSHIQLPFGNVRTITIIDNDAEVFVPAVLSVAEDGGRVPVCVTLKTYTEVNITVTLATSDGTGIIMCVHDCSCINACNLFLQLQMVLIIWEHQWTWLSLLVPVLILYSVNLRAHLNFSNLTLALVL